VPINEHGFIKQAVGRMTVSKFWPPRPSSGHRLGKVALIGVSLAAAIAIGSLSATAVALANTTGFIQASGSFANGGSLAAAIDVVGPDQPTTGVAVYPPLDSLPSGPIGSEQLAPITSGPPVAPVPLEVAPAPSDVPEQLPFGSMDISGSNSEAGHPGQLSVPNLAGVPELSVEPPPSLLNVPALQPSSPQPQTADDDGQATTRSNNNGPAWPVVGLLMVAVLFLLAIALFVWATLNRRSADRQMAASQRAAAQRRNLR